MSRKPEFGASRHPLRGFVESRGPDLVTGWAWREGDEPISLVFKIRGRVLGECQATGLRPDLHAAGLAGGRAAFAWRLPLTGPQINPAAIAVVEKATGKELKDAAGVTIVQPPKARGVVEVRGPEVIAGWATGRRTPLRLIFLRGGEEIGDTLADLPREELRQHGVTDGRAAFEWRLPFTDPPADPAEIEVRDEATGILIADAGQLRPVRPALIRGMVESRGPAVIAGWARGPGGPVTIHFMLDGERLGACVADRPRSVRGGESHEGFAWRLPFCDPPVEPARIEVREAATGALVADLPGLRAFAPPVVRGWIEEHGPDVISGWARGPEGVVRLEVRRGEEVLAEIVADDFRPGLRDDGVGDGRAGFSWPLPFGNPSFDASQMRVVEVSRGIEIPDAPGLRPIGRAPVCGVVEECSYRLVTGWAWNGRPGERVRLDMVCDGEVVGTCTADRLRKDLAAAGVDDGRHVFQWTPPRDLEAFDAGRLAVVAHPSGAVLARSLRADKPTGLEAADLRIEASWLSGRLRRTGEAKPPASLDVVIDGRFLLNTDIRALDFDAEGWAEIALELPRTINDGRAHTLRLHDSREGDPVAGQGEGLAYCCGLNSMIELVTPLEIRGWVIDADDPDGEGRIDLYDGDQLLRRHRLGRDRPEVAKAFGAAHAWEFMIRRLPLQLFDGETHEIRLVSAGRPLSPHKAPRVEVRWNEDQAATDVERFDGAVQEIDANGIKGFAIDYLRDGPVALEVLVDGEVVADILADRYVAALKQEVGHGFHGFAWRFPSALMNGRKRRVAVRLKGRSLLLPPKTRPVLFPLTTLDQAATPADLAPPRLEVTPPTAVEPALLSLIVLNLNGAHVLEPFLRSLAETEFRDRIELIMIDHGSTDESRGIIEAYRGRLALTPLYRGVNHSFSASCNLGAALAKGRYLAMVNNDIVFTGDCLAGMRDLLDAEPKVGLVGLRLLEPRYRGEGQWAMAVHHTGVRFEAPAAQNKSDPRMYHPVEVEGGGEVEGGEAGLVIAPAVTGALAMMRRQDYRALGGFDESYVYGYEDVDYALRMRGTLGQLAVCRLDDSAIHNRSATRESKLVADRPVEAARGTERSAHANLDLFTRRFSRHLPRLILSRLASGGEAWRAAPLRIAFVVADPERGPDTAAARTLGAALRDGFGWEPMLIGEDGHDLAVSDVLVSLRPGYDLRRIGEAAPGMLAVAWDWNGSGAWEGRAETYHLSWTLPPDAAEAARQSLAGWLAGTQRRIAIKAQAENEPQARALAQALERRGHHVRIDGPRHWTGGLSACDELVMAMAGVRAYAPFAGTVNALCLVAGAEPPEAGALATFDHVFAPGDPDVDAEVLLNLHDRLRREFLGGLAA